MILEYYYIEYSTETTVIHLKVYFMDYETQHNWGFIF